MIMQSGIRERWLLLGITLLGSGIIIGSELNRLPESPKASELMSAQLADTTLNTPLQIRPRHDSSRLIAKVVPVLETM